MKPKKYLVEWSENYSKVIEANSPEEAEEYIRANLNQNGAFDGLEVLASETI